MIKRLKIKDYMAHKETELELDPGVTVLTGPNNSGKSAVVEALRSVAQNPPPHHVIRHGASQAVVRVELDSGEAVEWVRSRGNTIYRQFKAVPDGDDAGAPPEIYAKFGRTPPEDIRNLLRLDLVETESDAVDIHIGNQRYPIFLLDQTGSQAASFFAASTEAEYLLRIQQALKTKTDRARSKRKELLQECAELEDSLKFYLPLEDLDLNLSTSEELYTRLIALQQALPRLGRTIEVLEETGLQHSRKMKSSAIFEFLSLPPQTYATKGLELVAQEIQGVLQQLGTVEARATALTALSGPPEMHDTSRLDALIRT
jgi:DNA repair ATPase RecN